MLEPKSFLAVGYFRRKLEWGIWSSLCITFTLLHSRGQETSWVSQREASLGSVGEKAGLMLHVPSIPRVLSILWLCPETRLKLDFRQTAHIIPCMRNLVIGCEVFCDPSYEWWMAPHKPVLYSTVSAAAQRRKQPSRKNKERIIIHTASMKDSHRSKDD